MTWSSLRGEQSRAKRIAVLLFRLVIEPGWLVTCGYDGYVVDRVMSKKCYSVVAVFSGTKARHRNK